MNGLLKNLRWLWLLLPLGMAGNVGLAMLSRGPELGSLLQGLSMQLLGLAAAMCLVPWFCNAMRLRIWTGFLGKAIPFSACLRISMISDLGAAATPTAAGGGPFKTGQLMANGFNGPQAVSLMFLGSLEDGMFLLPSVGVAVIFTPSGRIVAKLILNAIGSHSGQALIIALVALSVVAALWLLARYGKNSGRFVRLTEKVRVFWDRTTDCMQIITGPGKGRFLLTMPLAAFQWCSRYTALAVILAGFGIISNPIDIFLLQWTTFTLMNLIPTPGAFGGAEAAFIFVHQTVVPHGLLPLSAASWRLVTYYLPVCTASLALLTGIGNSAVHENREDRKPCVTSQEPLSGEM